MGSREPCLHYRWPFEKDRSLLSYSVSRYQTQRWRRGTTISAPLARLDFSPVTIVRPDRRAEFFDQLAALQRFAPWVGRFVGKQLRADVTARRQVWRRIASTVG